MDRLKQVLNIPTHSSSGLGFFCQGCGTGTHELDGDQTITSKILSVPRICCPESAFAMCVITDIHTQQGRSCVGQGLNEDVSNHK